MSVPITLERAPAGHANGIGTMVVREALSDWLVSERSSNSGHDCLAGSLGRPLQLPCLFCDERLAVYAALSKFQRQLVYQCAPPGGGDNGRGCPRDLLERFGHGKER